MKDIYGHNIDKLLEMRKEMLLNEVAINDMIYLIDNENLVTCIIKKNVNLKDIEAYSNVGKLYGLTVYVKNKYFDDMSAIFKESKQ
jgi:hypothetical protein